MLITGGMGFIGQNLTGWLLDTDVRPSIVDLKCGLDVGSSQDLRKMYVMGPIVHLAADPGVSESIDYPTSSFYHNAFGTFSVLKLAADVKARAVLTSSAAADHLTSPYGASKKCGEVYAQAFHNAYGVSYCALRLSNVYGPLSDHKTSCVANMIKSAIQTGEITIYGDGKQTRDFIHVSDVVEAILAATESEYNGVLNVGSGEEHSIHEVAEIIAQETGAYIKYENKRKGDVMASPCPLGLTQDFLRWCPQIPFEEGILKTLDWFRRQDAEVLAV